MLRRVEASLSGAGSKPLIALQDGRGDPYLFKVGDDDLLAAEVAACELRVLGQRPVVPARLLEVTLEDVGRVTGVLKPFLQFEASRELNSDTKSWTPIQRAVILIEHAWEWFLDNLDTNTGQYALVGTEAIPLNLDWDRSFCTECHGELSRFEKYKHAIPNARTFLYADYVEGRIDLPFPLLLAEARRIRALPVAKVRAALERYATARFQDPQAREAFIARALRRKGRIELDFGQFLGQLVAERRALVGPPSGWRARVRVASALIWKGWQLLLHRLSRGPLGGLGRGALRLVRSRRYLPQNPEAFAHRDLEPQVAKEARGSLE